MDYFKNISYMLSHIFLMLFIYFSPFFQRKNKGNLFYFFFLADNYRYYKIELFSGQRLMLCACNSFPDICHAVYRHYHIPDKRYKSPFYDIKRLQLCDCRKYCNIYFSYIYKQCSLVFDRRLFYPCRYFSFPVLQNP